MYIHIYNDEIVKLLSKIYILYFFLANFRQINTWQLRGKTSNKDNDYDVH